ncbi:FimV domain-containing protein [Acinetobacter sp. VNK23]|uniref:type IV pilus assembly protein FimV n=1 Tax=Acinetobacter thutiue TaxID=2998078 RepID=UPI00257808EA|nr:FimV domain-containing protein [Acinetobacter thutiue]MDM1020706.1 FimV domain-containing protein [Acinetobacter thutiue]
MTIYNKLKIAILTILSSQHLYAITLDPLQIQSAPGELLYAEMSFHQADANSKLDVSLATPEDLMMLGATHQPPAALNFFTRRNNKGEGVIVITSSRPMTDAELNIIVKIQENGAAHLKHIRQPIRQKTQIAAAKSSNEKTLAPKYIVSEKDIALNLPESTRYNANTATNSKETNLKQEKLLNAPFALPPALNIPESKAPIVTAISVAPPSKIEQTATSQAASNTQATTPKIVSTEQKPATPTIKREVQQAAVIQAANNPTPPPISNTAVTEQKSVTPAPTIKQEVQQAAVVQAANAQPANENIPAEKPIQNTENKLVEKKQDTVAEYQAKNKEQPIKQPSPSAASAENSQQQHVVRRNESLWSIAQRIAGQTQQPVYKVMNQIKAQNEHAFIGGNANRLRQGAHLNFNLGTVPSHQNPNANQIAAQTPHGAPAGKAKYRLQQAEMTLLAESNQDSSTGSAKKDTLQQKTSADLSLKVMTAREKTVTLQRNVTQLELALRGKEQRIQLLNARLAELQEQLKAQQETKKPTR